jgi:hypothetical protein
MKFDFTIDNEALGEKYRDRLHTLLHNVLLQNLSALAEHELTGTIVIRRGMSEDAIRETQNKTEKRRAKHLADFGTLQGFQE